MSPREADSSRSSARVIPFPPGSARHGVHEVWKSQGVDERLRIVRRFRHLLAERSQRLVDSVDLRQRRSRQETLVAEVLPLADACLFLERRAPSILAPARLGFRGRPSWLFGSRVEIHREPWGLVLIIGPSNYPILLPGVQLLQALTAGNAVVLKPGKGASESAAVMLGLLQEAGLPDGLVTLLDEEPAAATRAIERGVDKVVLTGSHEAGVAVAGKLSESLTPAVMELSGCDAVIVGRDAQLDLVVRALRFGLAFNSSFTCIAPRRVLVHHSRLVELEERLIKELEVAPASAVETAVVTEVRSLIDRVRDQGARLVGNSGLPDPAAELMFPAVLADVTPQMEIADADLAAPVLSLISFESDQQALSIVEQSRFRLGAAIFGKLERAAELAAKLPAGVVVINDLIVPTADPRVPFGGRGASGYGVTRGAEGLLELSQPKTIIVRRGTFRPHFDPTGPEHEELFRQFIRVAHGGTIRQRLRALLRMITLSVRLPRRHD